MVVVVLVVVVVIAIVLAIVLALALIPVLMYKIFQIKGPQLKNFIAAAPPATQRVAESSDESHLTLDVHVTVR